MRRLGNDAMTELVEGGKLKRADILLTHAKCSLLGTLVRFGTRSYWDHSLMVFTIKDEKQGYDSTFVIDSDAFGIDIHNIGYYFERPRKYDVLIKRLELDWLDGDSEEGGLRYCRKVRGFALQEIDDKYDYRMMVKVAAKILRRMVLVLLFPLQRRKKHDEERRVKVSRLIGINVNAYICSGFVQWSYYQAMSQLLDDADPDKPNKLQGVIFNPAFTTGSDEEILLSTTPADLANSDKLSWQYVIKDGVVWQVSSKAEEDAVTGRAKKRQGLPNS